MRTPARDRHAPAALLVAVLLLGMAQAMAAPYVVLFGKERLGLPPLAIGVFVSVTACSGMLASVWLGRWFDRRPRRMPVLLAALGGAVGFALLARTRSYPALLLVGATGLGVAAAAFPQLFALARTHVGGSATRATAVLRSAWSLAWAVGPPIGGALLSSGGYRALFLAAGGGYAVLAIAVVAGTSPTPASASPADGAERDALVPRATAPVGPALAFGLFHTAMFAGSVVLPLFVTETLAQSRGAVGMLFSLCAVAEIPAALALVLVPRGAKSEPLLVLGMALFVLYFAATTFAGGLLTLAVAQVARGVAIAVVGALGITYFQDLMPGQAGRATALFANTATAGSLLSGVLAGATAQWAGYRAASALCGVLAASGAVLLLRRRRETREDPLQLRAARSVRT